MDDDLLAIIAVYAFYSVNPDSVFICDLYDSHRLKVIRYEVVHKDGSFYFYDCERKSHAYGSSLCLEDYDTSSCFSVCRSGNNFFFSDFDKLYDVTCSVCGSGITISTNDKIFDYVLKTFLDYGE